MPQATLLEPGCYYHIYARGNNRQNIFFEERNYHHFMKLYAKHIDPLAETFAYCLMRNHFHLLVRIKRETDLRGLQDPVGLSQQVTQPLTLRLVSHSFGNLLNSYAKAINKAYHRTGSLFEGRFGRLLVDSDRYFLALVNYIHRNPQKHGFVNDFRDWPYSSYHNLLLDTPTSLQRGQVLNWLGGRERFEAFHAQMAETGEIRHLIEDDED